MLAIKEILEKHPYYLKVRFNNDEVRKIDFTELIKRFPVLSNPDIFLSVRLDDYPTLSWSDLAQIQDYDGKIIKTSLDFSPDMLWELGKPS
ncbi:MAG: hypothetical protein ABI723_09845 [Bacteroidia bacterium]